MSDPTSFVRDGRGTVRPYLYSTPANTELIQELFDAQEHARYDTPGGAHVELVIGDAMVVLESAESFPAGVETTQASVYAYVQDVDAVFAKAETAGVEVISKPEDKPYQERQCGIKDLSGNTWWISTYIG